MKNKKLLLCINKNLFFRFVLKGLFKIFITLKLISQSLFVFYYLLWIDYIFVSDSDNVYPEFHETDITDISIFKCLEENSTLTNLEVSDKHTHKQEIHSDKKIVCKHRYKQLNKNS